MVFMNGLQAYLFYINQILSYSLSLSSKLAETSR